MNTPPRDECKATCPGCGAKIGDCAQLAAERQKSAQETTLTVDDTLKVTAIEFETALTAEQYEQRFRLNRWSVENVPANLIQTATNRREHAVRFRVEGTSIEQIYKNAHQAADMLRKILKSGVRS